MANSPDETLKTLHQDGLKKVTLPVGGKDNVATGVVFSNSDKNFVITQRPEGVEPITAPAKFLFASDGGIISAWTERKKADSTFDRAPTANNVIDHSKKGAQYFGLAISHDYSTLYAANFGEKAGIESYDGTFKPLSIAFDQPFDSNKNGKVDPGEYAPFNIQALTTPAGENHLFVTYAKTQPCPKEEIGKACKKGKMFVGEEDTSKPGQGKLAEFSEQGKLIATWDGAGLLSAPWGLAFAPARFGEASGALLVANFGDGTITAFDPASKKTTGMLKDSKGETVKIDKAWGLIFGNGASLGDTDSLYYAAGPEDEKDGVFGKIRVVQ